ncbi:MAG: response regulator [Saprospiraceae bacterium]|nr:response regulator [Saprospiraceae bacterium]
MNFIIKGGSHPDGVLLDIQQGIVGCIETTTIRKGCIKIIGLFYILEDERGFAYASGSFYKQKPFIPADFLLYFSVK